MTFWLSKIWIHSFEVKPILTKLFPTLPPKYGNFTSRKMHALIYAKLWNECTCISFRHGNYHVIKYCYGHVVRILWRQNRPSIDLWLLFRDNGDSVNKNKSVNNTNIKNELEKTISSKTVSSFSSSFWVPIHNTLFLPSVTTRVLTTSTGNQSRGLLRLVF